MFKGCEDTLQQEKSSLLLLHCTDPSSRGEHSLYTVHESPDVSHGNYKDSISMAAGERQDGMRLLPRNCASIHWIFTHPMQEMAMLIVGQWFLGRDPGK